MTAAMHTRLWRCAPPSAAVHIVAVIVGGLALDALFGWRGQCAAMAWTTGVWAWLYRRGGTEERRALLVCTVIAAVGEVVLSPVWGLYEYRLSNVSLFVPPGHALLMTLGLIVSQRLIEHELARRLRRILPWLALAYAVYAWMASTDQLGALLFGVFGLCMIATSARMLYCTMLVLALVMEVYGTSLQCWRWAGTSPHLGVTCANPPFAAGAFYCVLDLLVLAALARWSPRTWNGHRRPGAIPASRE